VGDALPGQSLGTVLKKNKPNTSNDSVVSFSDIVVITAYNVNVCFFS